jgi:hypothetical protein
VLKIQEILTEQALMRQEALYLPFICASHPC